MSKTSERDEDRAEGDDERAQGLHHGGVPEVRHDRLNDAARMMKTTLAASPGATPAIWAEHQAAPTMRMSPSASKPSWVIQLKKLMIRAPSVPKLAREIVKMVVPASGACKQASPSRKNERLPRMMSAEGRVKAEAEPHEQGAVDEVLDLHAGPAHIAPMLRGVAQRSLSGMKSMPCCSTRNAGSPGDPSCESMVVATMFVLLIDCAPENDPARP